MEEEAPEREEEAPEIGPEPKKPRRGPVKIVAAVIAVAGIGAVSYFAFFSGSPARSQPFAFFIARQDQMTTSFDASGSAGGGRHPTIPIYRRDIGGRSPGTWV